LIEQEELFNQLKAHGIEMSDDAKKRISERLEKVLNYEPQVGFLGKTGVGKSSLANALFGRKAFKISDVEACTRETQSAIMKIGDGKKGIKIYDVPGVGESRERDKEYADLYAKLLPELDLVLWLIKSDDRALASDENFYKEIVKPHINEGKAFFFVLNQVDKIEPFREWDDEKHEPGTKQFQNIDKKKEDVANFFNTSKRNVIAISANEKYNLPELVDAIVFALPKDKKFTVAKEIPEEFISEEAKEDAEGSLMDTVLEIIETVVDKAVDVAVVFVEKVWEKMKPWWWPW
jgi:small GTP-binding protein